MIGPFARFEETPVARSWLLGTQGERLGQTRQHREDRKPSWPLQLLVLV